MGVVVMAGAKLTDKQRRFCDEYLIDLNATQAAIRSGYSEKTAYRIGAELLQKTSVAEQIEKRKAARVKRTEITQDFVLMELLKIAKADGTDFATVGKRNRVTITPTDDLPADKRAAVAGVKKGKHGEIEVKTYDKLKALELLGRHLGIFDKQEGPDGTLFTVTDPFAGGGDDDDDNG